MEFGCYTYPRVGGLTIMVDYALNRINCRARSDSEKQICLNMGGVLGNGNSDYTDYNLYRGN